MARSFILVRPCIRGLASHGTMPSANFHALQEDMLVSSGWNAGAADSLPENVPGKWRVFYQFLKGSKKKVISRDIKFSMESWSPSIGVFQESMHCATGVDPMT